MDELSLAQISNQVLKPTRDGYGEALVELGMGEPEMVVLAADLRESTRELEFSKKYPERFIECGVAEQNMAGVAAGLAMAGKIPWISSYAVFSPGRNWDQIRVSVCYSNLNVKIAGHHAGLSVGPDGATHQGLEDVAITRVLPNMTVVVPCDAIEAKKATVALTKMRGPGYLRLFREKTPVLTDRDLGFEIGRAYMMCDGRQSPVVGQSVAIVGSGPILSVCLEAAKDLESEGISASVINNHTIKPLDKVTLLKAARDCGAVVTVEEHQVAGGMGSAVAEMLATLYPVPMEMIGVEDSFGESGKPEELWRKYGLTKVKIIEAVKMVIKRKINV